MSVFKQRISLAMATTSVVLFSIVCFMLCPLIDGYSDVSSMAAIASANTTAASFVLEKTVKELSETKI